LDKRRNPFPEFLNRETFPNLISPKDSV